MEKDIMLLEEICASARMERNLLGKLIRCCKEEGLRNVLAEQFAEYHKILLDAEQQLMEQGCTLKIDYARPRACTALSLNLCIDKSSSHIAEIVMHGNFQSVIDTVRLLKTCQGTQEPATMLAERLQTTLENNIEQLQDFL